MHPEAIAVLNTLIPLGIAGVLDWMYREIDPEIWGPWLVLAPVVGLLYATSTGTPGLLFFYALSLVFALLLAALYALGHLGGADMLAGALIALSLPVPRSIGLPPVVTIILYASILGFAYRVYSMARAGSPLSLKVRVRAEDLILNRRYKWWIPDGVNVEEDWTFTLASKAGEHVYASPGMPLVSFMLLGLILYLVVGDPLTLLLRPPG
ncbi:MAG: hypothetical protein F7C35_04075 [Desulfurococcales archaeon]|nr:hypothetical protein [Desulfurococcales archaeon]